MSNIALAQQSAGQIGRSPGSVSGTGMQKPSQKNELTNLTTPGRRPSQPANEDLAIGTSFLTEVKQGPALARKDSRKNMQSGQSPIGDVRNSKTMKGSPSIATDPV